MVEEKKEKRKAGDRLENERLEEERLEEINKIQQKINQTRGEVEKTGRRIRRLRILFALLTMSAIMFFASVLSVVSLNLTKEDFAKYNQFFIFNENTSYYSEFFSTAFIITVTLSAIFSLVAINLRSYFEKKENLGVSEDINFTTNRDSLKDSQEKNKEPEAELKPHIMKRANEITSFIIRPLEKTGDSFENWRDALLYAHKRLRDEEKSMKSNNNGNLASGVLGAGLGLFWLFILIFSPDEAKGVDSFPNFLANHWSRVGSVIIVGIITAFFLRLYTQTVRRIDKNRNEITNIELRLASGLMMCDTRDKTKLKFLAEALAKEERNFVLDKTESSTGISIEKLLGIISKTPTGGG